MNQQRLHGIGRYGVTTVAEFRQRHAQQFGRHAVERADAIIAEANEGRWTGDCPACGASMLLTMGVEARCFARDCGSVYPNVSWPTEFDAIEDALVARPKKNQNWLPHESAADLRAENVRHMWTLDFEEERR